MFEPTTSGLWESISRASDTRPNHWVIRDLILPFVTRCLKYPLPGSNWKSVCTYRCFVLCILFLVSHSTGWLTTFPCDYSSVYLWLFAHLYISIETLYIVNMSYITLYGSVFIIQILSMYLHCHDSQVRFRSAISLGHHFSFLLYILHISNLESTECLALVIFHVFHCWYKFLMVKIKKYATFSLNTDQHVSTTYYTSIYPCS